MFVRKRLKNLLNGQSKFGMIRDHPCSIATRAKLLLIGDGDVSIWIKHFQVIYNNRHKRPCCFMLCTHSGRKQRIKTTLPVKCNVHNWFLVIGNSDLPDFIENNGDAKKASLHYTANDKSTKKLLHVSSTSRKHDVTDDDNNKESTVKKETVFDILVSDLPNVIAKKTDEYFNQEFSVCRKEIKWLIAFNRCVSNAISTTILENTYS